MFSQAICKIDLIVCIDMVILGACDVGLVRERIN